MGVENSLCRCNMFQELINCCCYLLQGRAKSRVFVLFVFLIETSDFVGGDEKVLGKGHQSTFQHGWQYGSLFVCSFTCYLLKPSMLSAWGYLKGSVLTVSSHTLLCMFERSIKTNMFSVENISVNTGLKTAKKKRTTKPPNPPPRRFYTCKK